MSHLYWRCSSGNVQNSTTQHFVLSILSRLGVQPLPSTILPSFSSTPFNFPSSSLLQPSFSPTHSTLTFPLTPSSHFFSPLCFFTSFPYFLHTFPPLHLISQFISLLQIFNHVLFSPTPVLLTSSLHQLHRYTSSHLCPTPASFLCANLLYPLPRYTSPPPPVCNGTVLRFSSPFFFDLTPPPFSSISRVYLKFICLFFSLSFVI